MDRLPTVGTVAGTSTVNGATVAGTLVAGGDYTAVSGTLTFTSGQTTKSITITITADKKAEPTEAFTVVLSGAIGATLADATGVVTILDNDAALTAAETPAAADDAPTTQRLTSAQLDSVVGAAKAEWISAQPTADFMGVTFSIAALDGLLLGVADGKKVTIDVTAAGWGWTVVGGGIDLLTVVMHELGHVLGLEHGDEDTLMGETLGPGERYAPVVKLPASSFDVAAPATPIVGGWFLGPVRLGMSHRTPITASRPLARNVAVSRAVRRSGAGAHHRAHRAQ